MIGRIGDVLAMMLFGLILVVLGLVEFSPTGWANDALIIGGLLTLVGAVWLAGQPLRGGR